MVLQASIPIEVEGDAAVTTFAMKAGRTAVLPLQRGVP